MWVMLNSIKMHLLPHFLIMLLYSLQISLLNICRDRKDLVDLYLELFERSFVITFMISI